MENCRDRILSALFRMIHIFQKQYVYISNTIGAVSQECSNLQSLLQQCRHYYEETNNLAYVSRAIDIQKKLKEYSKTYLLYENELNLLPDFINKLASPLLHLLVYDMNSSYLSLVGESVGNQTRLIYIILFKLINGLFFLLLLFVLMTRFAANYTSSHSTIFVGWHSSAQKTRCWVNTISSFIHSSLGKH